jgi:hypothetical protein
MGWNYKKTRNLSMKDFIDDYLVVIVVEEMYLNGSFVICFLYCLMTHVDILLLLFAELFSITQKNSFSLPTSFFFLLMISLINKISFSFSNLTSLF